MSLAQSILNRAFGGEVKTNGGYDPTGYRSPWTDEKDGVLINLLNTGHKPRVAAEKMGLTECMVRGRINRLRETGKL